MTVYTILLFLHILGAAGMFAAWGVEGARLGQLRQVRTRVEFRNWIGARSRVALIGPVGMLLALGTGVWMMAIRWMGPGMAAQPWMPMAVVALVLIVAVGIGLGRGVRVRFAAELGGREADLSDVVAAGAGRLGASLALRVAFGIAILALMTAKPGIAGSGAILSVAAVVGLGAAKLTGKRGAVVVGERPAAGGLARPTPPSTPA